MAKAKRGRRVSQQQSADARRNFLADKRGTPDVIEEQPAAGPPAQDDSAPPPGDAAGAQQAEPRHRDSDFAEGLLVPPVRGLANQGNTCFMNSTLQVLMAAPALCAWGASTDPAAGALTSAFQQLLQLAHNPGGPALKKDAPQILHPSRLHTAVCKSAPRFRGGRQQDSHELLRCLLGGIQQEHERASVPGGALQAAQGKAPKEVAAGGQPVPKASSALTLLFEGQLSSRIQCQNCQHTSTSLEPFQDLSVPIPYALEKAAAPLASTPRKEAKLKQAVKAAKGALTDAHLDHKVRNKESKQARKLADHERRKQRRRKRGPELPDAALAEGPEGPPVIAVQQAGSHNDTDSSSGTTISTPTRKEAARPSPLKQASSGHEADDETELQPTGLLGSRASSSLDRPTTPPKSPTQGAEPGSRPVSAPRLPEPDAADQVTDEYLLENGDLASSGPGSQASSSPGTQSGSPQSSLDGSAAGSTDDLAVAATTQPPQQAALGSKEQQAGQQEPPEAQPVAGGDGEAAAESLEEQGPQAGLHSCLEAFFTPEDVIWTCPKESAQPCSDAEPPATPRRGMPRRSVSFSGARPSTVHIPGSAEQRGTDFRAALEGEARFCRPLRYKGAALLVTAELSFTGESITLRVHPHDDEDPATARILPRTLVGPTVKIQTVRDASDEVEQVEVAAKAQVLMDCGADMIIHEGLRAFKGMHDLSLQRMPSTHQWQVKGRKASEGDGFWEYPSHDKSPRAPLNHLLTIPSGDIISPHPGSYRSRPAQPMRPALRPTISTQSMQSESESAPPTPRARPNCISISLANGQTIHVPLALPRTATSESPTPLVSPGISPLPSVDQEPSEVFLPPQPSRLDPSSGSSRPQASSQQFGFARSGPAVHSSPFDESDPAESSDGPAPARRPRSLDLPGRVRDSFAALSSFHSPEVMPEHVQRGGLRSPPQPYSSCPNFRAEDSSTLESDGSFRGPSGRLLHTKPSLRSAVKRQERPGVQQTASKGYLIHRAPQLLTVHFKRFRLDGRGRLAKVSGHIPFTLDLDISQFMDPQGPNAGGAQYKLVGVVEHRGSQLGSGHYVAYVQRGLQPTAGSRLCSNSQQQPHSTSGAVSPPHAGQGQQQEQEQEQEHKRAGISDQQQPMGREESEQSLDEWQQVQWSYVSDTHVESTTPERVLACEAYILLYTRVR